MLGVRIFVNLIRTQFLCLSLVAGLLKMSSDHEVLLVFYRSTGVHQWLSNGGWNTDDDISLWYGVQVQDGRVVGLDLNYNNLKGNIPSHRLYHSRLPQIQLVGNSPQQKKAFAVLV